MEENRRPNAPSILKVSDLYHARDQGNGWILKGIELELQPGELVHLKGDNGSGKSTLLQLLAGERKPARGRIEILGSPLGPGPNQGRQNLVLVPDTLVPSPWLGPAEYLALRARWRGLSEADLAARLEPVLEQWNLVELRDRPVEALSFGEKRRVVLAAAALLAPPLLLLDEPSNGLDRHHREIASEFLVAAGQRAAVLVTTHVERQDLPGATRTLLLEGGRIEEVRS